MLSCSSDFVHQFLECCLIFATCKRSYVLFSCLCYSVLEKPPTLLSIQTYMHMKVLNRSFQQVLHSHFSEKWVQFALCIQGPNRGLLKA